jgi:hypothetical protein
MSLHFSRSGQDLAAAAAAAELAAATCPSAVLHLASRCPLFQGKTAVLATKAGKEETAEEGNAMRSTNNRGQQWQEKKKMMTKKKRLRGVQPTETV